MWLRNSAGRFNGWQGLLALLALALTVAACSKDVTGIGVALPSNQANTGAYLIDTLTVRTSTVLRDSVVTSTSGYLLVGRATDPLLGRLTARSAFRLGVPADNFTIDGTFVYDSVVLVLATDAYRFGDTTRTQALFEVHPLRTPISATKVSFASPKLTTLDYDPALVLNKGGVAPTGRARPNLGTLRLKLDDATFGRPLLAAGQSNQYITQDLFDARLPGLALVPATNDNGALVRLSATATSGLMLYYHDPTNPTVALSFPFTIAGGARHFYQVEADRSLTGTTFPSVSLQTVDAGRTGEQTFIEGALGLQTKVEIPYLSDLATFGNNLVITNAQMTAQVPAATVAPFIPAPPAIVVSGASVINQPVGTYVASVSYLTSQSATTGLDQGSYNWSVTSYIQAVLNHTLTNNGLLLSSTSPELPSRVVLGSPRNVTNKFQLRVYLIQVQ